VDWLWIPKNEPYVFVPESAPGGRTIPAPNWQLMVCASTSLTSPPASNSPSGIVVFKKVVIPAQAILGVGINDIPSSSGWSTKTINFDDPVEVALAGELQSSALAHVVASTSHAYVGPWNAFVLWCHNLLIPRMSTC
jgi:hypothetical protein